MPLGRSSRAPPLLDWFRKAGSSDTGWRRAEEILERGEAKTVLKPKQGNQAEVRKRVVFHPAYPWSVSAHQFAQFLLVEAGVLAKESDPCTDARNMCDR